MQRAPLRVHICSALIILDTSQNNERGLHFFLSQTRLRQATRSFFQIRQMACRGAHRISGSLLRSALDPTLAHQRSSSSHPFFRTSVRCACGSKPDLARCAASTKVPRLRPQSSEGTLTHAELDVSLRVQDLHAHGSGTRGPPANARRMLLNRFNKLPGTEKTSNSPASTTDKPSPVRS